MKKLIALFLAVIMLVSVAACTSGTSGSDKNGDTDNDAGNNDNENNENNESNENNENKEENKEDENVIDYETTMDIYIIAGQSNAVGFSILSNLVDAWKFAPELIDGGFTNVHYAGSSRFGGKPFTHNEAQWGMTTTGFGANKSYIGPEVGMAKALSKYYNEKTGRHAGIIKFAHGGSSMRDISSGENATGNWVSPSYAAHLNTSYADDDVTGGYYRLLLEQVKKNISQIKEYSGHTNVNIVGLYWMQGETDIYNKTEYETSFKYFVPDLRKDLAEIMLEFTDGKSDCGASDMAVLIGAISEGFAVGNASTAKNVNAPFIALQKKLAGEIENCYFVDNSQYLITKWNPTTNKADVLGSDQYHWNQNDMLQIGKNVGEMLLNDVLKVDDKK